jgi:hypothetical protein
MGHRIYEICKIWRIKMGNKPQRQDSLSDQLYDLSFIADENGMYDAGTYLRDRNKALEKLEMEFLNSRKRIDLTLKEIIKLNNWFTAHLLFEYAKINSSNKKHIDNLYLEFNRRWEKIIKGK